MSRRTAAAGAGHPWPAWFQDSVQHAQLLTNKTLREYLLAHSAERWPEVAKATLLYGVLCLRRDFPGRAAVPLDELHEAARRLHTEAALGAALPAIRSQFQSLEAELGSCLEELGTAGGDVGAGAPAQGDPRAWLQQPAAAPAPAPDGRARTRPASSSVAAGPSPATAGHLHPPPAGDAAPWAGQPPPQRPRPNKQAAIYPDWWPGPTSTPASRRAAAASARQRQQPRLAYSRPPTAPPSVTQDDLPTAAFLLVQPRVAAGGGGGASRAQGSAAAAGQADRPGSTPATSRVKLQHAQRLALQRQERQLQQEQEQHGMNAPHAAPLPPNTSSSSARYPGDCGPHDAGTGLPVRPSGAPASPRYPPEAVSRWRAHFGL